MKKTIVVEVERCSWSRTSLLMDVDEGEPWGEVAQRAMARGERGVDVEWRKVKGKPPHFTATIVESQDANDLMHLLEASKRPAGLDDDEKFWLEEVRLYVDVSDQEIGRWFNGRREQRSAQAACASGQSPPVSAARKKSPRQTSRSR